MTLFRVLNGRADISPEMALRIEAWLGAARGGEARLWLAEQSAYDVWQAEQRLKAVPMHVQPAPLIAAQLIFTLANQPFQKLGRFRGAFGRCRAMNMSARFQSWRNTLPTCLSSRLLRV